MMYRFHIKSARELEVIAGACSPTGRCLIGSGPNWKLFLAESGTRQGAQFGLPLNMHDGRMRIDLNLAGHV